MFHYYCALQDLVGIIRQHQLGDAKLRPGYPVSTRILDVSKAEGIVDLSASVPLVDAAKQQFKALLEAQASSDKKGTKKFAGLSVGDHVEAVVELVKDALGYVILSLPERGNLLAFAAITDYNQKV
jgi:hypothetical protein